MNPRSGGVGFELYSGTSGIIFLQNTVGGGQPLAIMNSLGKSIEIFGDVGIPDYYKIDLVSLIPNINLSNYYNKN